MAPLQLIGFTRLGCGCLVGRYLQRDPDREIDYVEDKGWHCGCADHRLHELLALSLARQTGHTAERVAHSPLLAT